MIDASVKLTVLAAAVWILTRRASPSDATAAHRLWMAVLVSPFVLLASQSLIPPVAYVIPRPEVISATEWAGSSTVALLLYAYAAGVGLLLVRAAIGVLTVRRLIAGARALPPGELARLRLRAKAAALDIREGDLPVPVTAGVYRQVVILPRTWRGMTPRALETILRHEAAHVRRRDCAVGLLCEVLLALLWFHPAAWLAAARIRWFAELACDAEAAAAMDRRAYASQLLGLAAEWAGVRLPPVAITAGAGTNVACRIRLLLDEIDGRRRRPWFLGALAAVVIATPLSTAVRFSGTIAPRDVHPSVDLGGPHQTLHDHGGH